MKSALSSGYAKIVVNEDTTVDEDMTVSARTTLVINKSLEVASGSTLTIKGTLKVSNDATIKLSDDAEIIFEGEGKIVNEDNDELYIITTESNNGQVSTDSNLVKAGEEVTVTTEANDGYKLKSLKVINLSTNEEVEVKDNKFSMPESNVKVIAEFEKLEDISVPNTLDNISSSLVLGLVSVIGIVGLICIFKRKLQN